MIVAIGLELTILRYNKYVKPKDILCTSHKYIKHHSIHELPVNIVFALKCLTAWDQIKKQISTTVFLTVLVTCPFMIVYIYS